MIANNVKIFRLQLNEYLGNSEPIISTFKTENKWTKYSTKVDIKKAKKKNSNKSCRKEISTKIKFILYIFIQTLYVYIQRKRKRQRWITKLKSSFLKRWVLFINLQQD